MKYLGGTGNILHSNDIDFITHDKHKLESNEYATHYLGADTGFGSSNTAITIVRVTDKVEVVYSQEFERPEYETMVSLIHQLAQKYSCCKIFLDGSNTAFVSSIKRKYGRSEYQKYWLLKPEVLDMAYAS